jgi:hypothetical protein
VLKSQENQVEHQQKELNEKQKGFKEKNFFKILNVFSRN